MKLNIRILYLYLFSFVGLIVTVIGAVRIIELALKVYLFKGADIYEYSKPMVAPLPDGSKISTEEAVKQQQEQIDIQNRETVRQRQREASGAMAMLFVGFPLYLYHWRVIQKEAKERNI